MSNVTSVNNQYDSQYRQQLTNMISLIMREIEAKKQLIRKVRSDQREVKKCLIELTKELFQSIVSGLNLDRANINMDLKNSIANITDLNR